VLFSQDTDLLRIAKDWQADSMKFLLNRRTISEVPL
jgi:hypothetical protein